MNTKAMQKNVMKRVYYVYVIGFLSQVIFWQGLFLGASALLLGRWLHVSSVIDNFLSVPVGRTPRYVLDSLHNAITHGEIMTAIILISAGIVTVSAGYHIAQVLSKKTIIISRLS